MSILQTGIAALHVNNFLGLYKKLSKLIVLSYIHICHLFLPKDVRIPFRMSLGVILFLLFTKNLTANINIKSFLKYYK